MKRSEEKTWKKWKPFYWWYPKQPKQRLRCNLCLWFAIPVAYLSYCLNKAYIYSQWKLVGILHEKNQRTGAVNGHTSVDEEDCLLTFAITVGWTLVEILQDNFHFWTVAPRSSHWGVSETSWKKAWSTPEHWSPEAYIPPTKACKEWQLIQSNNKFIAETGNQP